MEDSRFEVTCQHCGGTGHVALTGVYLSTLLLMQALDRKGRRYFVANRDAALFRCKATALNNRMVRLEQVGFLRSERFGRERRFSVKKGGAQ